VSTVRVPLPARRLDEPRRRFEYQRHEPESTALYAIVREHLDPFLRYTREHYARPLPPYVERELRRYLDCGVLSNGFTRIRCPGCGLDVLLAFSCKGRSLCPSCGARRMAATAAHLVDRVLPDAPVRQWVLSVPWELRMLLAARAPVLSAVVRIFHRVVLGWYRDRARDAGLGPAETGAISVVQRFGGSLNLHCHIHSVAVDGVYCRDEHVQARFQLVRAPTKADIENVARETSRRVVKMLRRRGLVRDDDEDDPGAEPDEAIDGCRRASLGRGRFERLDRRGRSQQELFADDAERLDHRSKGPWAAEVDGFSVHAGVAFGALDRKGREKLLRYCLRPPLAIGRLSLLNDGAIAYRLKVRRRGGKTHRVMAPVEFMARIAALVAPPRIPLLRYHGILAPSSSWRPLVVPATARSAARTPSCAHHAAVPLEPTKASPTTMPTDAAVIVPSSQPPLATASLELVSPKPVPAATKAARSCPYIDWATLMRRTFNLDVLDCPRCHDRMVPIAVIARQEVAEHILSQLDLPLRPQPLADRYAVAFDVTGEPMVHGLVGMDPEPCGRSPPDSWDCLDPPAPDE